VEGTESTSGAQIQPPYGSVKWYDDFFRLLERIEINKVDAPFLKTHEIAGGNEYKLITGLKFLDLINQDGTATDRMKTLRLTGEKYTENFQKMVNDAYSVLIKKVDLEKAKANDVVNTLIDDYKMARSTAKQGTKIFVFLAQKANIPISTELAEFRTKELEVSRERKKEKLRKEAKETKEEETEEMEGKGMYIGRLGDSIFIKLRKDSDRKTREKIAKHAKTLIDLYVEGEEMED
jgi:hypothetical protein